MQSYRSDIDGLRALAVGAVVFFHAGLGLPGGFVGVDVFFVISGFLIASLIAADLERGTFSLVTFWDRRIRRIWPAALLTTIATLAVGWCIFMPDDFRDLADNAAAQILMVANMRIWRNGGDYFAADAETNPLLHMWSLAVEEQFYCFFPLIMALSYRLGRRICVATLVCLAVGSFAASVVFLPKFPSAVFYLLPFRAWELFAGALLAVLPLPAPPALWVATATGFAGLAGIAAACLWYDGSTPFPGLAAVVPCVGAAMVIAAGGHGSGGIVGRCLGCAPLRFIGKMSYSIYLWHWPLLAFMRYVGGPDLAGPSVAAALIATAMLSYLSWRFIETPFRSVGTVADRKRVVVSICAASLAVLLVTAFIRSNNGFPGRFSQGTLSTLKNLTFDKTFEYTGPYSTFSGARGSDTVGRHLVPIGKRGDATHPDFLFWGDSHGMAIGSVVDKAAQARGLVGCCALRRGTAPLAGVWHPNADDRDIHSQFTAGVLQAIQDKRPRNVILCGKWTLYLAADTRFGSIPWMAKTGSLKASPETSRQAFVAGIRCVAETCDLVNAKLWILAEVPRQPAALPKNRIVVATFLGHTLDFAGITWDEYQQSQRPWVEALALIPAGSFTVCDLSLPFFDEQGQSIMGRDGLQWYADTTHLNPLGAEVALGEIIGRLMDGMARQPGVHEGEKAAEEHAGD